MSALPPPSAVTTEYRIPFDESPVVDAIRGDRKGGRVQIRVTEVRITERPGLPPAVEALGKVVRLNGEKDPRYRHLLLAATSVRRGYLEEHLLRSAGLKRSGLR